MKMIMTSTFKLTVVIFWTLILASITHARTWTDTSGNNWEGYLIGVENGSVRLVHQPSGRLAAYPLTAFSAQDQAYIRQQSPVSTTLSVDSTHTPHQTAKSKQKKRLWDVFSPKKKKAPPVITPNASIQAGSNKHNGSPVKIKPLPTNFTWTSISANITGANPLSLFGAIVIAVTLLTFYTQTSLRLFKIRDNMSTGIMAAFLLVVVALTGFVIISMFGMTHTYGNMMGYQALMLLFSGMLIVKMLYDLPFTVSFGISFSIIIMLSVTVLGTYMVMRTPIAAML